MSNIRFELNTDEFDNEVLTIGQYSFINYATGWLVKADSIVIPKAGNHLHAKIDYALGWLLIEIKTKQTSREINLRVQYDIKHTHHWINKFKEWVDRNPNATYEQYGKMFDKRKRVMI